jgi:hypothetical protein
MMETRDIFLTIKAICLVTVLSLMTSAGLKAQNYGYNSATGNVKGRNYVGGLTGRVAAQGTKVHNSYARGSVEGVANVGGLAGHNGGLVENSYATGRVNGTSHAGGLAGSGSGTVAGSYWDIQTTGQPASAGGFGRNTDPMTYPYAADTYTGWDFSQVWQADLAPSKNNGYPYLKAAKAYRIAVQVYPPHAGTVIGEGIYPAGSPAQLEATSGTSFKFKGWYIDGEAVSDLARFSLKVTQNVNLVARFVDKTTFAGNNIAGKKYGMELYPNPARDWIRIRPDSPAGEVISLKIMNISGQPVMDIEPDSQSGGITTVSLRDLTPGIYIVIARFQDGVASGKVVKY